MPQTSIALLVLSIYAAASVATFIAYGWDKRRAVRAGRRIPERTLHGLELIGGWPGALLAQAVFRHKRRKTRYVAVFVAIVALHVGLWIVYLTKRPRWSRTADDAPRSVRFG